MSRHELKIALVHDYLKEYGGAEKVLETLHEIWPEAPIYTTVFLPKYLGPHQDRLKDWKVIPSFLQRFPFKSKLISPFRLLAPLVFDNIDFRGFDAVIVSSTGAFNPNLIITRPETVHICYCHTPPRYLYGYPTARNWKKHWWGRMAGEISNHLLRQIDFLSSQRVDFFIANSKNTAERIKKFYRREATIIYPPVDMSGQFSVTRLQQKREKSRKAENQEPKAEDYYLAGGRLAKPKRIDLAVAACTRLNLPLKVFGKMFAGYGEELHRLAGSNVEFLGEVTNEEKFELMANCKAFIFPAEEEDFGITAVEPMGFGTPVIALRQGGALETIVDGVTGTFFDEPTVESLVTVLEKFDPEKYKPEDCRKQAEKFSKERFKSEIVDFVNRHVKNYS